MADFDVEDFIARFLDTLAAATCVDCCYILTTI